MDNVHKSERLFPISEYGNDFYTGVTGEGKQVIMGLLCPVLVAFFSQKMALY